MAKLEATTFVLLGEDTIEKELVASPIFDDVLMFCLNGKEIFRMDRENFLAFAKMVLKTAEA